MDDLTVLITGAGGFIGRHLARRLLAEGRVGPEGPRVGRLVLTDRTPPANCDPRAVTVTGDLADAALRARLVAERPGLVFHTAGLLGGASERDPVLSRHVNFDAPLYLFEALAATGMRPRVVNTSSIAVYGIPMPASVTDAQQPMPTLAYGTHKVMLELHLAEMTRRGAADARTLRLPAVVAKRPLAGPRPPAAFWADIFHAGAEGRELLLKVTPEATIWMMSVQCCVDNLLSAAVLPETGWPPSRTLNIPALRLTLGEIIAALVRRHGPQVKRLFRHEPDDWVQAQYGSWPLLVAQAAERLGLRDDGDAERLLARVEDTRLAEATPG